MKEYKYIFSVISAVYNAEAYLEEMIDSITAQTIGFKENVQLILVNDGSRDNSLAICRKYEQLYPENVIVIDKPNGGVSSARNAGLEFAEGEFLNFTDSDDKLSPNVLSEVYDFFSEYDNDPYVSDDMRFDVVNIPFRYFDGAEGGEDHDQNKKFEKGKRVVDLTEEFNVAIMNVTYSFIRAEAARGILYDEEICIGEDLKYVNTVLLERRKVGLLPSAIYYYRKHSDGSPSLISTKIHLEKYYLPQMRNLTHWSRTYSMERYGDYPLFFQFAIVCDFKEKVCQKNGFAAVLGDKFREYYDLMEKAFMLFDDKVVLSIPSLSTEYKVFWLTKKYGKPFDICVMPKKIVYSLKTREDEGADEVAGIEEQDHIDLNWFGSATLNTLYIRNGKLMLEGFATVVPAGAATEEVKIFVRAYNKLFETTLSANTEPCLYLNTDVVYTRQHFTAEIPLCNTEPSEFSLWYSFADGTPTRINYINYGRFAAIGTAIEDQVYIKDGFAVKASREAITVLYPKRRELARLNGAYRASMKRNAPKYIVYKRLSSLLSRFIRSKIWLISDRSDSAGDNGEALFRYLSEERPRGIKPYFVITRESKDFERMKRIGKVAPLGSKLHKILYFLSDANISAHFDANTLTPIDGEYFRDVIATKKVVFLQHGVTKDDIHEIYSKYKQNTSLFICASEMERESIVSNPGYGLSADEAQATGFARFDNLKSDDKRMIVIMPTWRKYLFSGIGQDGKWIAKKGVENSDFCVFYKRLLSSKKLVEAIKKYGYSVCYAPHPNVAEFSEGFDIAPEITVAHHPIDYNKLFREASLMITDYSSTAFDFAYMRKPVIYAHFDREKFFSSHTYREGYFSYEENGFGEVTKDVDDTIDLIIGYMADGCKMRDKYLGRANTFFAHDDTNNCQRITEAIDSMDTPSNSTPPSFKEKKVIPIVLACNDKYSQFVSVTVQSIIRNCDMRCFYDIYVFNTDITPMNVKLLEESNELYRVRCIDVSKFIGPHVKDLQQNSKYISVETYYRLVIPSVLPQYDKVIYLDCDLIVLGDVAELYSIDIGDNLIGGVRNPLHSAMKSHIENDLSLDSRKYVNAGVLVMNTARMRAEGFEKQCFDLLASGRELKFMDQDTVNLIAAGRIHYYDMSWNYEWHYERLNTFKDKRYHLIEGESEEYEKASENIRILHYTGDIKPWNNSKLRFGEIFWEYANKSIYYQQILLHSPLNPTYRKYLDAVVELENIRKSKSYKIGRFVTFPLRCARAVLRRLFKRK